MRLVSPDKTAPLCRTSSMFWTMILCTSWSSVFRALRFLRPRPSVYVFFAF